MKNGFLCLLFLFTSFGLFSQTKESALKDANVTAHATLKEDFKTVLQYTHPNVLEISGGIDVLLPQIEEMFAEMKTQGLKFIKAEVLSVSDIVQEQGESRCLVKNLNIMEVGGRTMKSSSYLMGFFPEDAEHWVFVEAEKMKNPQLVQALFPDFKTSMDIPEDSVEIVEQ